MKNFIYEVILPSWNTKIQVRVGEAARGDKMCIALRNEVEGENEIGTKLQTWERAQDQICLVKNPVQGTEDRNEESEQKWNETEIKS